MILQILLQIPLSAAVAYCRAMEYSLHALALSSASHLAAASEKLLACLCCLREGCSADVPATVTLHTLPFTKGWELCSSNHYLAPAVDSLVSSFSDMLSEGFSSWRESIYCSTLLGDEMLTRIVDMLVAVHAILQENNEPIQGVHALIYD